MEVTGSETAKKVVTASQNLIFADIDYIQIRSDNEGLASNRSYNYRVCHCRVDRSMHDSCDVIARLGCYDQEWKGAQYAWSLQCWPKSAYFDYHSSGIS